MGTLTVKVKNHLGNLHLDARIDTSAERLGIIGPSGAGKSTLANILAGHLRPDHGHLTLHGETLLDTEQSTFTPPHERNIGYLMQDAPLLPHLSTKQNLLYPPGAIAGSTLHDDLIGILNLEPLLDQHPSELSGGERRRVSLAQVLMSKPSLLILDEPVVGLNESLKKRIMPELRAVLDRVDCPSIVISHEPPVIRALCNRGLTVRDGTTHEIQPANELFESPSQRRQAGLSETNVFRATVRDTGDEHYTAETENGLDFYLEPSSAITADGTVVVSFRAADLILAESIDGSISTRNQWGGTVQSIEEADGGQVVSVEISGHTIYARVTHRTVSDMNLKPDRPIIVLLKSQALQILPA